MTKKVKKLGYNPAKEKLSFLDKAEAKKATVETGLEAGYTRATFILQKSDVDKLKALAFWERKRIQDVATEAFKQYFAGKKIVVPPLK